MTRKNRKTTKYNFQADEFIKIWFSKNPDIFLPMVNQIRFINFILDHPGSSFHFIYKDSILSREAKSELLDFCEKFGVTAINFDDVKTTSSIDKQLKQQVNIEIENAINNKGGDLGSASDMARIMPNIIKLGFYLDFDTKAKFDQKSYSAKGPILAEVKASEHEDGRVTVATNNQFVAVAKQKNGKIHKDAEKALEDISKDMLSKYSRFEKAKTKEAQETVTDKALNILSNILDPILNIYSGFKKVKIKNIDAETLDILSNIFSINLSYTSKDIKEGKATTDNMLVKYILGKYFESDYSLTPSICSLREFIKKSDNLIYKAKEFMSSELASFGHNYKEAFNYLNESYDLTDHVIYSISVVSITGPQVFTNYMIENGQENFILDKHLSKAISSQFDKVEIEPGVEIDRDGDTSWSTVESLLTENRTKIFELEELTALNTKINIDTDTTSPLHNILEEYLILGCKEIKGGFSGLCQNFNDQNITESNSTIELEMSGNVENTIDL